MTEIGHDPTLRANGLRLLAQARLHPVDLVGESGALTALVRRMIERILEVELGWHLGYGRYQVTGRGSGNSRNGSTRKTLRTDLGRIAIEVPRDRAGTFRTQLIVKHSRQLQGVGEGVLRMFARPPVLPDLTATLFEIFPAGSEEALVEKVGTKLDPIVGAWRARPLPTVFPVVLVDSVELGEHPIGFAAGVMPNGRAELIGLCEPRHSDARRRAFLAHLHSRGLADVGVCCYGETWQSMVMHLPGLWPHAAARADLTAVVAQTVALARHTAPPVDPARERSSVLDRMAVDEHNLRTAWPMVHPS